MYDLIKTLAAHLLMPIPVTVALLALGFVLWMLRFKKSGLSLLVLAASVLYASSTAPLAHRLLLPLEAQHPALLTIEPQPPVSAVVVLGGGWRPNAAWSAVSKLNESSALRLMEGIRLWRQQPHLPLMVTGAGRDDSTPIAVGYAEAAISLGVPPEQLVVLDWPTDTGLEARAVRGALGEGAHVVLVTSASHMPRAMRHFEQAGLTPLAAPTHYLADPLETRFLRTWLPSATHLRKTERAVYERLGMVGLWFERG